MSHVTVEIRRFGVFLMLTCFHMIYLFFWERAYYVRVDNESGATLRLRSDRRRSRRHGNRHLGGGCGSSELNSSPTQRRVIGRVGNNCGDMDGWMASLIEPPWIISFALLLPLGEKTLTACLGGNYFIFDCLPFLIMRKGGNSNGKREGERNSSFLSYSLLVTKWLQKVL